MKKQLSMEASKRLRKKEKDQKVRLAQLIRILQSNRLAIEYEKDEIKLSHMLMDENLLLREIKNCESYISPLLSTDLYPLVESE